MLELLTVKKKLVLVSLLVIFIGCTKKNKNIDFGSISTNYSQTDELIITSISAEEESELFKYQIRLPKVIGKSESVGGIQEFNDDVQNYANEVVKNLEGIVHNSGQDHKKPSLKLDYEIYHGYNIYTVIISATQDIKDISITNYRSYYINDNGDYIQNIDEIIEVESAFPFFMSKIQERVQSNDLLFDLQQAVIYFKNKSLVIKLPAYVFNLDEKEDTNNIFEFNEKEISKYIKDKIDQK
ncbi:hypothetical protein [Borrelia sp. RT1S]|uniref:hypothetical protein n=1 Tax=Borrelia sp. RT1S TaxID=2898580 RepID=UPI001E50D610|nr:hypothetical protein [Borrelia sp. RT1S]UGQ17031.1 hypothetical protein LSO05_01135 [Borrelia sp. RT1S]